jgi:hypothetical protein
MACMTGEQMKTQAEQQGQVETWALVEIFGHTKLAGFCKTEAFGTTVMLRVDVPDLPERKRERSGYRDADGNYSDTLQKFEETLPAEPGYTRYYGMGSIFSITPCTEATARAAVDKMRRMEPKVLHVGSVEEPARLPSPVPEAGFDNGGDGIDEPELDDDGLGFDDD